MSFGILNLNGIQSTVIDPRPLDKYRITKKLEFGYYHRNEMFEYYNPQPSPGLPTSFSLPQHVRAYFEILDSSITGSLYSKVKVDKTFFLFLWLLLHFSQLKSSLANSIVQNIHDGQKVGSNMR